jgi:alpha-L-fucosidase
MTISIYPNPGKTSHSGVQFSLAGGNHMSNTTPLPAPYIERFESLAFGMFIHWGLYSQTGKGEWIMHHENIPFETYRQLQDTFTAKDFDMETIAGLAAEAGMKYITLTTRHHEGFSLYDTKGLSRYDAPHSPAKRDLVGEFVEGCRKAGLVPFFYHTTLDWSRDSHTCDNDAFNRYLEYLHKSLELLCTGYGPIGGFWFDGDWSRKDADWRLDERYGIIRSSQPEAMIINNTGIHQTGVVSHPEVDSVTFEQHGARAIDRTGHDKYRAAEMCQTIPSHWGFARMDFTYKSIGDLLCFFLNCRKSGANYLLNIGPEAQGGIRELERAMLREVGRWIRLQGDFLYRGKPVPGITCQGRDFLLAGDGKLYYMVHDLKIAGHGDVTLAVGGSGPRILKGLNRRIVSARWVDNGEALKVMQDPDNGYAVIDCSGYPYGVNLVVRIAELTLEK